MPGELTDDESAIVTDAIQQGVAPGAASAASPLTDEQFRIITAHVLKFHEHLKCPFCGTVDEWSVEPIGVVPDFGPGTLPEQAYAPKSGRLYVALGCRKCFFVYHFAWLPMEREARERASKARDAATGSDGNV